MLKSSPKKTLFASVFFLPKLFFFIDIVQHASIFNQRDFFLKKEKQLNFFQFSLL